MGLRAVLYHSTIEDDVWIGLGSSIIEATIPSHTMIPAASIIRSDSDMRPFRFTDTKEEDYISSVFDATSRLREGYLELYRAGIPKRERG